MTRIKKEKRNENEITLNCYYKGRFIINAGLVSQIENKKKSFL